MKSSAGKILSFNNRSLALSNFLRRWQTFIPQFICLLTLWTDLTDNDWKKNGTEIEMGQNKWFKQPDSCF